MAASLTVTPASVAQIAQALGTPIRDEAQLVLLIADFRERLAENTSAATTPALPMRTTWERLSTPSPASRGRSNQTT